MSSENKDTKPPSLFCSIGSPTTSITDETVRQKVDEFLESMGQRREVLILPPDFTRFHSQAGMITRFICEHYGFVPAADGNSDASSDAVHGDESNNGEDPPSKKLKQNEVNEKGKAIATPEIQVIPALGTHAPMTQHQIELMFGKELAAKKSKTDNTSPFIVHNWRDDVVTIGHAPAQMVSDATYGMVNEPWPAQLNKKVWEKRILSKSDNDGSTLPPLIISVGQVVPHEVMGMANFNKNLFVGVGGVEAINLSHFIGAVHGMEKLMGRGQNPLRSILNYASEKFLQDNLDLWYILTVMGSNEETGKVETKGLYIGRDVQCYDLACDLSLKVNFNLLDKAPKKIVVYLNDEYHSTWLGNKSIYRTRMAIDDGGELVVIAPWVETFGEDAHIDTLIRKVGYVGTPKIMEEMGKDDDLKKNLSAVAHLIHGSSEGRFSVRYCPGKLSKEEIESVGFMYSDLEDMKKIYDINCLKDGWNKRTNGDGVEEEFFYISNPALGLWAVSSRFEEGSNDGASAALSEAKVAAASGDIVGQDQIASDKSGGVGGWKLPP